MAEILSHITLQHYWWVIISLLAAILVFLMFIQGGQTLIYTIGKTEFEKKMLIKVLGRKWGLTFTALVIFGVVFFVSFPLFYTTSFIGAYWIWIIIILAFVFQAIAYEFRSHPNNLFNSKTCEIIMFISGFIFSMFIGIMIATFFTGSPFSVNEFNQSQWETPWHGLELTLNFHNLSLGFTLFFFARLLGLLFFLNRINDETVEKHIHKQIWHNGIPYIFFFLVFLVWLLIRDGFAIDPVTSEVYIQQFKYYNNLIEMPIVLILSLIGLLLVFYGISVSVLNFSHKGMWISGSGTIISVFSLFLISGLNNTSYNPSIFDLQSSLTIKNSSSSHFTLTVMSFVSLFVPFVIAFVWYLWRTLTRKKMNKSEIEADN